MIVLKRIDLCAYATNSSTCNTLKIKKNQFSKDHHGSFTLHQFIALKYVRCVAFPSLIPLLICVSFSEQRAHTHTETNKVQMSHEMSSHIAHRSSVSQTSKGIVSSVSLKSLSIVTTHIFSDVMKFSEQYSVRAYNTQHFHDSFVEICSFFFRSSLIILYKSPRTSERTKCIGTKNKSRGKKCNR